MANIKRKSVQIKHTRLILASQSPQRREILEGLGIPFEVIPSEFDESTITERDPVKRAELLSEAKAKEVAEKHPDRWVIGVDTLVVSEDDQLLEKPVDVDDARRMLRLQSGRRSAVHSAICLMRCETSCDVGSDDVGAFGQTHLHHTDISTAHVTFRDLTDEIIEDWITSGLWQEHSGAFQIELPNVRSSEGIENHPLLQKLEGEFETIVGFPVEAFRGMINLCG